MQSDPVGRLKYTHAKNHNSTPSCLIGLVMNLRYPWIHKSSHDHTDILDDSMNIRSILSSRLKETEQPINNLLPRAQNYLMLSPLSSQIDPAKQKQAMHSVSTALVQKLPRWQKNLSQLVSYHDTRLPWQNENWNWHPDLSEASQL